MINNRQNGRRRGRGGQQVRGGQPGPNGGSRVDNRARGNAAQLLEKYKTLARDAQMQGDRVNTEYYLQFADHYFRVLAESRSRFEEQRRGREDYRGDDYDGDGEGDPRGEDGRDDGDGWDESEATAPPPQQARPRRDDDRRPRQEGERPRREEGDRVRRNEGERARREDGERPRRDEGERPRRDEGEAFRRDEGGQVRADEGERELPERAPAERGERRPRRTPRAAAAREGGDDQPPAERIELDRLPPAFAAPQAEPAPEASGEAERPRRRPRRPREAAAEVEA